MDAPAEEEEEEEEEEKDDWSNADGDNNSISMVDFLCWPKHVTKRNKRRVVCEER